MINIIKFCSILLLSIFSITVNGQISHHIKFSSDIKVKQEILEDGETYERIILPETQQMDSISFPLLPVKYVKLIVPANATDFKIVVENTQKQKFNILHKIEPTQAPIPIGFSDAPDFVKPDSKKYNSSSPYPTQIASIVETGYFRGNHIITVAVFPVQYYPLKDELDYYETVDFTLSYQLIDNRVKSIIKGNNNQRKILESIVDNPSDIEKFSSLGERTEVGSSSLQQVSSNSQSADIASSIPVTCDYLVVTSQSLAPAFSDFINWKQRKGIRTQLVTIEDIYSNYTGDNISGINDDAGKLRQFLADAYNNGNGIEYALLGGDDTVIPIRHACFKDNTWNYQTIPDDGKIPTDLYFSDFDGDWNVDGDQYLGELQDNVDFNQEIYIGRVMVTSTEEVKNWTKKVLLYEQNPGNGDYSYLTRAYFTQADDMQYYNWASIISNDVTWCTSKIDQELGGPNTTTTPSFPTGKDVITEFNKNYGFTSFLNHGGATNIIVAAKGLNSSGTNTKYKVISAENGYGGCCMIPENGNGFNNMTNVNYPSINYSTSCETMPFDDYTTPVGGRNMGETYTCISKGGGPAYLGNTRYGFLPYSSKDLFREFIKVINLNTSFKLGVAEAISKQIYNDRYLRFSHNLIGCPETEIWTAIPTKFISTTVTESGNDVIVNTGGVSNSTICLMSAINQGADFYELVSDASSATFHDVPKPYLVTITKHNYIPYIKNCNIYIQNETFQSEKYIIGDNFYAGENVTTSKPVGPVKIQNGSNVVFDATNDVSLEGGFEVELGGIFEVK